MQLNQQLRRSQRTASRLLQSNRAGGVAVDRDAMSDITAGAEACGGDEACSSMSIRSQVGLRSGLTLQQHELQVPGGLVGLGQDSPCSSAKPPTNGVCMLPSLVCACNPP